MKHIKLIKQHDEYDCGAACFSMICHFYGKKIPLAIIRQEIGTDKNGSNMYGILSTAKKYGMNSTALEGNIDELIHAFHNEEITLPCIARVINHNQYEHYVVIYKITKEKLYIADPDLGKFKISIQDFEKVWLGQIANFQIKKDFIKENLCKSNFHKYFSLIIRQPKLLFCIFVLSLIISGIGVAGTYIFQYMIDNIGIATNTNFMNPFSRICVAVICLYITKSFLGILRTKLLSIMSKNIDLPLMLGYYDHMVSLPMSVISTYKTGEILSRFGDTSKIRDAISNITLTLMLDVWMALVCGIVLYHQSPKLFLLVIVILIIYVVLNSVFKPLIKKMQFFIMNEDAQFNSFLKETVDGIQTIKAYTMEKKIKERTKQKLTHYINSTIKGRMLEVIQDNLIELVSSIGSIVLLWIGASLVTEQQMTLGTLITFSSLLGYFITPIENIIDLQSDIQSAIIATERLADIVDCKKEKIEGNQFQNGKIEFENIDFRYGHRNLVLDELNFVIEPGSKVAIVGESGCGKTTIANLLMNFYQPQKGTIKINGLNINEIAVTNLRKHIAYITQRAFFFSDTIKNNLIMGLEDVSDEAIWHILNLCGCKQFIEKLPFGIETMLEENGVNLSGGQRQRLAIARALLHNPNILILDEATSQLDTIAEVSIRNMLMEHFPHITCIMIAHRLNFIKNCNQILVFEQGKLIEQGTHETLISGEGKYFDLWKRQHQ